MCVCVSWPFLRFQTRTLRRLYFCSQQGLSQDVAGTLASAHKSVADRLRPTRTPYKLLIISVRARTPLKWCSRTILKSECSWRAVVFPCAPVDFPGSRPAVAACLRRMRFTRFAGHTNPSSNVALTYAFVDQRKDVMPCGRCRCKTGH